jgi:aryl-alcohol dehydrogenase-like predicted oxidoreductase
VIVASKFAAPMGEGPFMRGASRRYIMNAVEASLRRLNTDYIDLYQVHVPDTQTPLEETMRALDDMVRDGKVRYIGCSNYAAWQVCEALWTSKSKGLAPFVSVQPHYSIMERRVEAELVPFCKEYGIGILPYFPLASGFLTGKYKRNQPAPEGTRLSEGDRGMFSDANFDMLEKLESFSAERGRTVLELAFAWLLANPDVSSVIAGATKAEQVVSNSKAVGWDLTAEDMAEVDTILKGK